MASAIASVLLLLAATVLAIVFGLMGVSSISPRELMMLVLCSSFVFKNLFQPPGPASAISNCNYPVALSLPSLSTAMVWGVAGANPDRKL